MPGIIIVDDEELIRFSFSRALKRDGLSVAYAENGKEAIEKINSVRFDLAIVDLNLGDISGIEVIRRLKSVSPETKVIVITADASDDVREKLLGQGVDRFYEKPFDTYEIVDCIHECLSIVHTGIVIERRRSERRPYDGTVDFSLLVLDCEEFKKVDLSGRGINISETGIALKTDYPLTPGHVVEFKNAAGYKAGIVKWSMMADGDSCKAGIRFMEHYDAAQSS